MTKYRNRIMIAFAAVVMSLAMMPMITTQVHATDGVKYIYRSWNGSKVISTTKTANCVDYNSGMTDLHQGWWYVNGYHEVNRRVNVSGEVNIIILDGSTLKLEDGIHVPSGSTLNIYNTPGGENGHFHALADTNYCAAIGGNNGEAGGNINIHSGKVTADAYNNNEGEQAAGIGGGEEGNGGNITIYGGKVEATGANYAAGIGSGDSDGSGIHGGNVKIYGGDVTAKGGCDAAGIGGGEACTGGNITISGGKVTATGGVNGAGIGGGDCGDGGTIKITGGDKIKATGGANGAGIGGGNDAVWTKIEISGGNFEVQGGDYAAGIGSGDRDSLTTGGEIIIKGGDVTATGGGDGAGIGGGEDCDGGRITISGGKIKTTGGNSSAGLASTGGAGIGGGDEAPGGNITISGGVITEAQGGHYAAGIGGGSYGEGGTINISGGTITKAVGGGDFDGSVYFGGGAGIGSGREGNGGNITISGGDINVIGAPFAAGIGGGSYSKYGTILITAGKVTANGGFPGGSGIGSGAGCERENEKIVDITINGGEIYADGGGRYEYSTGGTDPISYTDEEGAAIGAGGRITKIKRKTKFEIDKDAFFNGKIVFGGGTVTTGRLGATEDACLNDDDVDGTIEFNGATVSIRQDNTYSSREGSFLVHADQIIIKEDSSLHQRVSYQESRGKSDTVVVPSGDRLNMLKRPNTYLVKVEPCPHEYATYVDKGDKHSISCKNCNYSVNEAHSYGEPTWTWAEDNSTASATFTCACGHEETPDVTVESKKTDDGQNKEYTAKANFDGKDYVDTKTVELPGPSVTKLPTYKDLTYTGSEQDLGTAGEADGGTFKYAIGTDATTAPEDSAYGDTVPTAKAAGTYYVWCKVFGDDYHRDSAAQSGTVKINKQTVSDPAIPAKFFIEGVTQKADVPVSDLYTVTKNEGGIDIGEYDVVLELTEADNYKWIDSDDATHTLKFNIVKAGTNIVTVSIDGWTYGEEANKPTVEADFGKENVVYTYARSPQGPWAEKEGVLDAGIWWVKASIPASEGHYPAGEDTARFEIAKASPLVEVPPTPKTLTYTGEAQKLVNEGKVTGGTMYYAVTTEDGEPSEYAEDIPTATETDTYYVWYRVEGDENHTDYEPHKVMARISANKTELAEAITEAKGYYNSIKDNESYGPAAKKLSDAISEAEEAEAKKDAAQSEVNDAVSTLNAAVENAKADVDDIDAANIVNEQLYDLPDQSYVTLDDKEVINAARKAYDGLTDAQKAHVNKDALKKLEDAEQVVKNKADKAVEELVEQKIASLPAKPGLSNRNAVKAARAAYNNLTPDQKALVPAEMLKKLTDAEKAIEAATKTVKTVTVNVKTVSAKAINKAVDKAGGSNKYVTKIVLGKKVKKISKGAFKSYKKVKTLEVKTKKLKKKSVKKSLKGSKITKVKVNVGKKKTNKKYIKKYKKIFTKKNCGKKVKVR